MPSLFILLCGVAIVVGGILVLRLHAFVALTLAALAVGLLTSDAAIRRHELRKAARASKLELTAVEGSRATLSYSSPLQVESGMRYFVYRDVGEPELKRIAELTIEPRNDSTGDDQPEGKDKIVFARLVSGEPRPGDLVIHPLDVKAAQSTADQSVGRRVAGGFGRTAASIGILIAMAAIIGKCLLDSGAADRIVRSALRVVGERGAPGAFVGSGFLLGIPVFFDTVFYLMIPLGKAMRLRVGKNYLLYVLTIVAGGTMAHSLVPPTPGPLFVAEELNVDIGLMILAGCAVGLFTATGGYLYALLMNARNELPLRESPDLSMEELQRQAARDESELPPLWLSLTPILLPVLLISGQTILETVAPQLAKLDIVRTLGDKNIALVLAAGVAVLMLAWTRRTSRQELARSMSAALSSAGLIILITAAGGAFGKTIQQTDIAALIQDLPEASTPVVITLAFLITTAVRTAQGSATVAMITAVGILSGLATSDALGFHPVYLALAIGCGSKPVAWMNDSGFWVICKMSGMTEGEGLRYITPMSILMGAVGLLVTIAGAMVLPMPLG